MVTTSGFAGTPVTRALVLGLTSTSLLTSILDIKHLTPIKPTPHLWPYLQFSRLLTFQLAYISSTELLFAVLLLYQLRVLERVYGARRYGSLVLVSWGLVGGLVVLFGVLVKLLSLGWWGYVPPGMTGLVCCLLVVWREEVPRLYAVKVVTGLGGVGAAAAAAAARRDGDGHGVDDGIDGDAQRNVVAAVQAESGVVLSDRFVTYLMAAQLALSQFPFQLLPALVGWVVGVAWREDLLPTSMTRWRIPAWVVGEAGAAKGRGQFEGLRRRLEEEGGGSDGMREVSDRVVQHQREERRGVGQRVMGYFTGS